MNQSRTSLGSDSGVIAIFLAAIIGILLLTSTTFAARVSTSELSQSGQVDQSEAAYYAAEAGVEEAIRRLVVNPAGTICQIFPEQFNLTLSTLQTGVCPVASSQIGDFALLRDGASPAASEGASLTIGTEGAAAANLPGNAWRSRKVTAQGNSFTGTQVKDESVQFDTSELCRRAATGEIYGTTACDPLPANVDKDPLSILPIADSLQGLQYCWKANPGETPDIEFTDVYWTNINQIHTEKMVLRAPYTAGSPVFASGLTLTATTGSSATPAQPAYGYCVRLNTIAPGVVPGTKFIFRFKPLYPGISGSAQLQNAHSIAYHAELLDAKNGASFSPPYPLYLPTNTFLIDVVGESGDIKRRIVAKVTRNGGILGIFDYLIYSGSSSDLCKPGITQLEGAYDTTACTAPNISN